MYGNGETYPASPVSSGRDDANEGIRLAKHATGHAATLRARSHTGQSHQLLGKCTSERYGSFRRPVGFGAHDLPFIRQHAAECQGVTRVLRVGRRRELATHIDRGQEGPFGRDDLPQCRIVYGRDVAKSVCVARTAFEGECPWGCKTSCGRPLVLVMEAAEHLAADDRGRGARLRLRLSAFG